MSQMPSRDGTQTKPLTQSRPTFLTPFRDVHEEAVLSCGA